MVSGGKRNVNIVTKKGVSYNFRDQLHVKNALTSLSLSAATLLNVSRITVDFGNFHFGSLLYSNATEAKEARLHWMLWQHDDVSPQRSMNRIVEQISTQLFDIVNEKKK
jgi:hypothetical protein